MSLDTKNITQIAQLKAENTEVLNQYAGALGQFVFDKSTEHMHVMKGVVGQSIKMANFADIAEHAYSKDEIDSKLVGAYVYRGTKPSLAEIQKIELKKNGDVYNAEDSGMNYAWDGKKWDALGSIVDLSGYFTKEEINTKLAEKLGKTETAVAANQDGQGRVIVDTYLEKESAKTLYQAKGEYLTPESNIDYAKIINVPKIVDYGTLTLV